jgi:hypothetical protein
MEVVKNDPLPDRERRKIKQDLEKNYKCPRLFPDPYMMRVPGLNWGLISCISPFSGTENAEMKDVDDFLKNKRFSKPARIQLMRLMYEKMKILLKFRGAFANKEDADGWARDKIGMQDGIETFTFPLYEYGFFPPNKYARNEEMEINYLDQEAHKFYKKEKMRKEEEARVFQRRMEIFRERTEENNKKYKALTDTEKAELEAERKKKVDTIEGVPIEKILANEKIKRLMTQDTFTTLQKLSTILGIEPERFFQAWAQMKAEDEEAEQKALENNTEGEPSSSSSSSSQQQE